MEIPSALPFCSWNIWNIWNVWEHRCSCFFFLFYHLCSRTSRGKCTVPSPWHLTWSLIMRKLGKVHVHQPSHEPGWTKLQGTYTQTWGALFSSYIFLYYLSCLVFQDAHGQSPYLQGDSSTNGPWSIAMFHYQEVSAKHQVINCESERACQTHGRVYIVVRPLAELCITCMLKHQHSIRNPSHLAQTRRRSASILLQTQPMDQKYIKIPHPLALTSHYLQCHTFFNMQKCQVRYSFSIQLVVAQCGNKSKDTVLSNSSRDFYTLALATSIAFIRVTLVTLQISGTGWCSAAIRPNLPRMYSKIRFVNMKCPGERSSGKNVWTFIPPNLASYNIL